MNSKFIVISDNDMADAMVKNGFVLVSHVGNTYTFLNKFPENFNYSNFDISQFNYSDMLVV